MEAHVGGLSLKRDELSYFAFEKTPCISLSCKLVPVQLREYKYSINKFFQPCLLWQSRYTGTIYSLEYFEMGSCHRFDTVLCMNVVGPVILPFSALCGKDICLNSSESVHT